MKKTTILVVDDEIRIRRMVTDFLQGFGYKILTASDGEEALELFYDNNSKIDLILLDVMMPKVDGNKVLSEIREYSLVPIIMLTAKDEEQHEISSLKSGADDYIAKPFSPSVLLARIETVLKRTTKAINEDIISGELTIKIGSNEVFYKGEIINLTPKEYDLLLHLVQNKNQVLNRNAILNAVWNYNYDGDERTVDTHIKQLRSKIDKEIVQTVHGLGYKFRGE
ncbi:MAG: response regulator transcription factor [Clostridia bacterium]